MSFREIVHGEIDYKRLDHRAKQRKIKFESVESFVARGGRIDDRKRCFEEMLVADGFFHSGSKRSGLLLRALKHLEERNIAPPIPKKFRKPPVPIK